MRINVISGRRARYVNRTVYGTHPSGYYYTQVCRKLSLPLALAVEMVRKQRYLAQLILTLLFGFSSGNHCNYEEYEHQKRCKPSLPTLLKFPPQCSKQHYIDILATIGQKYWKFGTLLLQDDTGSIVEAIEHECQKNMEKINFAILQRWISGTGLPVTWDSLVQVLHDIGLNVLADEMYEHLQVYHALNG